VSDHEFADGIWAKSFEVFKRNIGPGAAYVGGMLLLAILSEFMETTGGQWAGQIFIAAMLAIVAHLTVLKGVAGFAGMSKAENSGYLLTRFAWRGLILGLIACVPMAAAMFIVLGGGYGEVIAIAAALVILLFAASLVFAAWGTMLPACVMGEGFGFSQATSRGKLTFGYAFPRLLVAFGLLSFIGLAFAIGTAKLSGGDGNILPKSGGFDVLIFTGILADNIVGAFQIVMTAVILSRAYVMAEARK
jgi:hypothetical protein